jgi:hypothetical protein
MWVLVACLALATAIALPGVIVAATSSSPSSHVADYAPRAQIVLGKAPSAELMGISGKVQAALTAKGMNMQLVGEGPNEAELIEERGGHCPARVSFYEDTGAAITFTNSCGTGEFDHGNVRIDYSPPSIGPTVEQAVAGLR